MSGQNIADSLQLVCKALSQAILATGAGHRITCCVALAQVHSPTREA